MLMVILNILIPSKMAGGSSHREKNYIQHLRYPLESS